MKNSYYDSVWIYIIFIVAHVCFEKKKGANEINVSVSDIIIIY
jgi:hypothetical protein